MKIAIIGSGVSGLRAASLLAKAGHSVTVFERAANFGGAAHTLPVDLGGETRWVDMGVNDFNTVTYKRLVTLLDELGVPYRPLSDTASFYKSDGSVCYTLDEKWNTPMPAGMADEYNRFKKEAIEVLTDPKYENYTIAQYLTEKNYSEQFAAWNIYPRINGMYFAHDSTPETMPIRGVMHYYSFQEGFGGEPPKRMYFANGSGSWIAALAQHAQDFGVEIRLNTSVHVGAENGGVFVFFEDGASEFYDACVMACHATTCLRVLRMGVKQQVLNVLSEFSYTDSVSIAHTYAPVLPPDKNAWRTYNILIHDQFEQLRPYTITYVCNLHQNDGANPQYDRFENPYFFLSLNPPAPIPDRCVLKTPATHGKPAQPVIARFPHNILSLSTLAAQPKIADIQGENRLYFCGGWTLGAGLQEECLHSAEIVFAKIEGHDVPQHHYDSSADAPHFAPLYVREALGL